MRLRKKAAFLTSTALAGGVMAVVAATAVPVHASSPAHSTTASTSEVAVASTGFNCASPYLRDSPSYNGYTAGYSWAWNIEVGIGYNDYRYHVRSLEIQCLLNNLWGYNAGTEDGIFGPNTERAVREFQKDVGLAVDGIVGPNTWRVLRIGYQK